MTLEELDRSLPNGFHDAMFERIEIDYLERRVTIHGQIWTGDEVERERYEAGALVVDGLAFISIDQPDPTYKFAQMKPLWVDSARPRGPLPKGLLPAGCFAWMFFVNEWNSDILVVGRDARWQRRQDQ